MKFMTRELCVKRLHHIPGQNIVYLNNAKVACSTIKRSLWMAADAQSGKASFCGRPHDRWASPFLKGMNDVFRLGIDVLLTREWFSVVRNPFVRVLSAYLNKIPLKNRDPGVWRPLQKRFLMQEETPSFADFLQMLLSESVPDSLDQHFCPQTANLLYGLSPLDYVGQLERLEEVEGWMVSRGFKLRSHRSHATNARELVSQYYGAAEVDAVLRIYRSDFDQLGYSHDPGQLEPVRPVTLPQRDPGPMHQFLLCYKPAPVDVRRSAYNELKKRYGDVDFMVYLLIDSGLADRNEIMAALDEVASGRIANWRIAMRIGQVLARWEFPLEAAEALQVASNLMYPNGVPAGGSGRTSGEFAALHSS